MIDALVSEEFVLQMPYRNLNGQVALLQIAFIALLSVCGNMTAVGSRKLDGQAEVAVAVGEGHRGVWSFEGLDLQEGSVCHGDCGRLWRIHVKKDERADILGMTGVVWCQQP